MALLFLQSTTRIFVYAQWQMNRSYLAKNICENRNKKGSCCEARCQLKKNLAKVENEDNQQSSAPKKIKFQEQESFVITEVPILEKFDNPADSTTYPNLDKSGYFFDPHQSVFHPPNLKV